ncbi:ORC1-type DNA replication protein [Candidatus Woesearchaeota archaeon]|nr:ORC1-type DNA replication protein [Candidatus Woesearchaeota archaeon]
MGGQKNISSFFETYIDKDSLFKDKKTLQSSHNPQPILHRDNQIKEIAHILAPTLRNEKPSNLFIYGKTGTGKTLCVKYVSNQMKKVAEERNISLKILYINCKLKRVADTEYRLIAQLAREFGKEIPPTGLPTDEVYNIFLKSLDKTENNIVLILDEIDQLVAKAGDGILYNITRINSELTTSQISIVGISNDLIFTNNIDPRVKSSLSEEEIVFPPYNALQLQTILKERSKKAFKQNVITQGVIEKCAAFAAREHGDARRALELFRVAGEIAERKNSKKVMIENIDEAEDKIERDRFIDLISTQPKQFQATLYSIFQVLKNQKKSIFTGEVYELYKKICNMSRLRPLTQRRVSDIIGEMDMLGIINAKVVSNGRFGRTREISLPLSPSIKTKIKRILEDDLSIV